MAALRVWSSSPTHRGTYSTLIHRNAYLGDLSVIQVCVHYVIMNVDLRNSAVHIDHTFVPSIIYSIEVQKKPIRFMTAKPNMKLSARGAAFKNLKRYFTVEALQDPLTCCFMFRTPKRQCCQGQQAFHFALFLKQKGKGLTLKSLQG